MEKEGNEMRENYVISKMLVIWIMTIFCVVATNSYVQAEELEQVHYKVYNYEDLNKKNENIVRVYFKCITERGCETKDEGCYAYKSDISQAKQTGIEFPVYNGDGTIRGNYSLDVFQESQYGDLFKPSSIWDYVSKDYPISNDSVDYSRDYSKLKAGDVVILCRLSSFVNPERRTLLLKIYDPEMYKKINCPVITLDDGNTLCYCEDNTKNALVRTVKLSKKIDKKYTGKKIKYGEDASFEYQEEEELKIIAKNVTKDCETNYEKVYAIANWMAKNLNYNTGYISAMAGETDTYKPNGLDTRLGVCGDFSNWFQYMCIEVGVPCVGIVSELHSHGFNAVYVDDYWMIIDLTNMIGTSYDNAIFCSKQIDDIDRDATVWKDTVEVVGDKVKKGKKITKGNITYKITSCSKNNYEVAVVSAKADRHGEIDLWDTVKIHGVWMRITDIKCSFKEGKNKLKKVSIGRYVKNIKGNIATKNTMRIYVGSDKIKNWSKVRIGCKNSRDVTIMVPKEVYKTYKKKIKAKKSKVKVTYSRW